MHDNYRSPERTPSFRREVSCAEDFAVILTWEGQVIDSRGSLANNAPWRHQGRSLAPLAEWRFAQECNQVVSVAAGGTWSGTLHPEL